VGCFSETPHPDLTPVASDRSGEVVGVSLASPLRSCFVWGLRLLVVIGVFLGPPLWALVQVLEGGPLFAMRTVQKTVTVSYGILPDVLPVLGIWWVVLLVSWGMATGALPRMR